MVKLCFSHNTYLITPEDQNLNYRMRNKESEVEQGYREIQESVSISGSSEKKGVQLVQISDQ